MGKFDGLFERHPGCDIENAIAQAQDGIVSIKARINRMWLTIDPGPDGRSITDPLWLKKHPDFIYEPSNRILSNSKVDKKVVKYDVNEKYTFNGKKVIALLQNARGLRRKLVYFLTTCTREYLEKLAASSFGRIQFRIQTVEYVVDIKCKKPGLKYLFYLMTKYIFFPKIVGSIMIQRDCFCPEFDDPKRSGKLFVRTGGDNYRQKTCGIIQWGLMKHKLPNEYNWAYEHVDRVRLFFRVTAKDNAPLQNDRGIEKTLDEFIANPAFDKAVLRRFQFRKFNGSEGLPTEGYSCPSDSNCFECFQASYFRLKEYQKEHHIRHELAHTNDVAEEMDWLEEKIEKSLKRADKKWTETSEGEKKSLGRSEEDRTGVAEN